MNLKANVMAEKNFRVKNVEIKNTNMFTTIRQNKIKF